MSKPETTNAPSGHMRIVETRLEESQRVAVYVTIVFEDALGQRWTMDASAFRFDLEKEAETVKDASSVQQDWLRLAGGRITIVEDALAQARAERKYTDARIRELITNAER